MSLREGVAEQVMDMSGEALEARFIAQEAVDVDQEQSAFA
jgi:hypothetical protein